MSVATTSHDSKTPPPPDGPNFIDRALLRNRANIYGLGLGMLLLIFWLYPHSFHFVPAGHSAVLWKRFQAGTQLDKVYLEGMHVTAPWDVLTIYETRVQRHRQELTAISSNGLSLKVTVTMRYRPKKDQLPQLHVNVGPEYYEKIVLPEVQSLIRLIFGQYEPVELYTSQRNVIENSLTSAMGEISERYVVLDDLLIESIELPPSIREVIEVKLQEEQHFLAMQYRLQREEQEAERKNIEAGGIQRYQRKIAETLTPLILQYHGVNAMMELSRSDNAKFVIANGNQGVPLILNTESPMYTNQFQPMPRPPGQDAVLTNAPTTASNSMSYVSTNQSWIRWGTNSGKQFVKPD